MKSTASVASLKAIKPLHKRAYNVIAAIICMAAIVFLGVSAEAARRIIPPDIEGSVQEGEELTYLQSDNTIMITGPAMLVEMLDKCVYQWGWITPGFSIDWGDGSTSSMRTSDKKDLGKRCSHLKGHQYVVPGDYTIKAKIYHLGATDAPETDWDNEADLIIEDGAGGIETRPSPKLTITNLKNGQEFRYQTLTNVKWTLETGVSTDVAFELLDKQGNVTAYAIKKDLASNRSGDMRLDYKNYDAYHAAIRRGDEYFTLKTWIKTVYGVTAGPVIENIHLSPEYADTIHYFDVKAKKAKIRDLVIATYNALHPDCLSYRLDWGDGSAPNELIQPIKKKCVLSAEAQNFTHSYAKPGTYKVKMIANNVDQNTPLDQQKAYETETIVITK